MKYLTRLLKQLKQNLDFNYHLRCATLNVLQLSFADDMLLFSRGDTTSIKLLFELFTTFLNALGLEANKDNSSVYFGGVPQVTQ